MDITGKKLGVLLCAPPGHPNFRHALSLAQAALKKGVRVYLYCMDDAVAGLKDPQFEVLRDSGANLYACAYGAQRRNIELSGAATFSGLGKLSELMAGTDRFVCFN